MKQIQWLVLASTITLLCGCSTLPKFDSPFIPEKVSPKVSDVLDEIQCEVLISVNKAKDSNSPLAGLQDGQYVANINLTLDVTDNQGVNPSLSYIDPLAATGTNFTAALSGQVSGQQHRNFNVTFTLLFDKNTPTEQSLKECQNQSNGSGLKGSLGIEEIISTGLKYETGFAYQNEYPYKIPAIAVGTASLPNDPLTGGAALAPNFGSTVDFTLIYGLGGGPNWTLTHFAGLNPASGGLLSFLRTNKDTLVISIARVVPTAAPGAAAQSAASLAVQAAGKVAQDNVTRMILQRLLTP
ncbi:hypothetical protein FSO04_30880 [Paraburkholderia madseniana]|uniref:Lipoprotein n=1 Tax=Paraburkholderia madseniana TaxID=2599607 RepID=A0A6N6W7B3_9BURK|nr:hypothetical protein [Paraburkholderia madseniana]KAE8756111.1 hypothetical protein FSO04_30880 [Paraburkholderia madseniana]